MNTSDISATKIITSLRTIILRDYVLQHMRSVM
jgi:hypothetical protein